MLVIDGSRKYSHLFYRTIEATDLRSVVLFKDNQNGSLFFDTKTGKFFKDKQSCLSDNPFFVYSEGNFDNITGYVLEYAEEHDVLIIRFFQQSSHFPEKEGIRKWIYLQHESIILDKFGDVYMANFKAHDSIVNRLQYFNCIDIGNNDKTDEILHSFFGDMMLAREGLAYRPYYCLRNILFYYSHYDMNYNQSFIADEGIFIPNDNVLTDEIKIKMLKLFDVKRLDYLKANNTYGLNDDYGIIQSLTNNSNVIRVFSMFPKNDLKYDERLKGFNLTTLVKDKLTPDDFLIYEKYRIYVYSEEVKICKKICNKWYSVNIKDVNLNSFRFYLLSDIVKDNLSGCKLMYFVDLLQESQNFLNIEQKEEALTTMNEAMLSLIIPFFENLKKNNYDNFIKVLSSFNSTTESLGSLFKAVFGNNICLHESNFLKATGISDRVIKVIHNKCFEKDDLYNNYNIVSSLNYIFDGNIDYLNNLNDSFLEEFMDNYLLLNQHHGVQNIPESLKYFIELYGCNNLLQFIKKLIHLSSFSLEVFMLYSDYFQMMIEMKSEYGILTYKFKTVQELEIAHDNLSYIYNNMSNHQIYESYNVKLKDLKKSWNKYLYSDDNFSIIMPNCAQEIAKEGISLHHCVKSYIKDVVEGKTLILFIRKTNEIGIPFFTLEIRDNKIRQCHGFSNSNTDTIKGLDDFLKEFCKKTDITYVQSYNALPV